MKNLYIFTGKGGVGKTTCSLAFCRHLQSQNKEVMYLTLEDELSSEYAKSLDIECKNFELWSSIQTYLERKLNSSVVAKLIMGTPFFRALVKMVPGFKYVIYMGHILNLTKNEPQKFFVLDSPSSGHLITLFESIYTFRDIFGGGILAKDLDDFLDYWNNKKPYKINIISLPHKTVLQESKELSETLKEKFGLESYIYLNCSLIDLKRFEPEEDLPYIIQAKFRAEEEALKQFDLDIASHLKLISDSGVISVARQLDSQGHVFI